MESPNFSNAEFINQIIWNTGVSQLVSGIHAFAGNNVFFQSGLLYPNSVAYTFPGNLTVQINLPSPFAVLFGSGAYCGAHGVVNGTDTSSYSVDFTSFLPGSGSQTVYLGITYGTVQQNPYIVIGPPVGHPDYSSQFDPYVAYASVEETLILTPTLTPPDNITVIELGRVTLTAGQSSISSLNTTFQQLASLLINSIRLSGDVTGESSSNVISNLQATPVDASNPTANTYFYFNGVAWVPRSLITLPPSGPAGGDLSGTYPNPEVVGIENIPINNGTGPTNGQALVFSTSNNKLNWQSQSLGTVYTYKLVSPVTLNSSTMTPVLTSINIPLPNTNGWRIVCSYTVAVTNNTESGIARRIVTALSDGTNMFGQQMQNPVGSGAASAFNNGFDVSPFYLAGSHVTITLLAAADDSGSPKPQAVSSSTSIAGNLMVPTELTLLLIPASA